MAAPTFSFKGGTLQVSLPTGWDSLSPEQVLQVWGCRLLGDADEARIKALTLLLKLDIRRLWRSRRFWKYFKPRRRLWESPQAFAERLVYRQGQLTELKRALDWVTETKVDTQRWLLPEIQVGDTTLYPPKDGRVALTAEQWVSAEDYWQALARNMENRVLPYKLLGELYQPGPGYDRNYSKAALETLKEVPMATALLVAANFATLSNRLAEGFPILFPKKNEPLTEAERQKQLFQTPTIWQDYVRCRWTEPQTLTDNLSVPPDVFLAALEGAIKNERKKK